jgi:putative transposase
MAQGKKHSEDEILKLLKEIEAGATIASVARAHGITESSAEGSGPQADQIIYRWREKYGRMQSDELKRLKELEAENARLKRIVARQALEIDAYKEVAEGKR